MKMNKILFAFIIFMLFLMTFSGESKAEGKDTVMNNYAFKVDLVPLYFDFFDYRKQIRAGIDFEMKVTKRSFVSLYWDMGLYDDYKFTKYYNFFNQGTGFYSEDQRINIRGFHFMPSYIYYFWRSKVKLNQGMYAGAIVDFNYYRKNLETYNSQSGESSSGMKHQVRMGAGLSLGGKYYFGSHFFAEIKTSFLAKIFELSSQTYVPLIKPVNAQWVDKKNNFWWVSNLNFGYAF